MFTPIKNKKVMKMLELLQKHAKNHWKPCMFNLLAGCSSKLNTEKIKKIWVINLGSAGIGKTYCTVGLMCDLKLFSNAVYESDFSPEAFQDIVCYTYKDQYVLNIPEIDEFMGNQDKMVVTLKNLYDGKVSKTLKGSKGEGEEIVYDFDSVLISGANVVRDSDRFKPVFDRYFLIMWHQNSKELLEKISNRDCLSEEDIVFMRDYLERVILDISNLEDLSDKEYKLVNSCFSKYVKNFNERSQRPYNYYKSFTKIASVFLRENKIRKETAEDVLKYFIENKYEVLKFTHKISKTYYEKLRSLLINDLFSKHEFVSRKTLSKFIMKHTKYSKTYIETHLITKLISEENLLKIVKKRRKYYYKLQVDGVKR